jgi:hypothetical protein
MLNKIAFCDQHHGNTDTPLDIGLLVEAMIFYGHVEVIGQWSAVNQLIRYCGPEGLRDLLENKYLHLSYQENWPLVAHTTDTSRGQEIYAVMALDMRHTGPQSGSYCLGDVVERECLRLGIGRGRSRRLAASVNRLSRTNRIDMSAARAMQDLNDQNYLRNAALNFLHFHAPGYVPPDPLTFEIQSAQEPMLPLSNAQSPSFTVNTNIDFAEADSFRIPSPEKTTALHPSDIVSQVVLTRSKLDQAAALGAEIATSPLHSRMLQERINRMFPGTNEHSSKAISLFNQKVLRNGLAIREVVNSGERQFPDVLDLLSRADKFKEWIRDQPHDVDLLEAYIERVTASSWASQLPKKALKWMIFESLGVLADVRYGNGAGSAIATSLGFADTFILDFLLDGWHPHQFVGGALNTFVNQTA